MNEAPKYWGFNSEGKYFQSDSPVDNQATRMTIDLIQGIRMNLWSPMEFVLELGRKPEWYWRLWPEWQLKTWGAMDDYALWPLVPEGSSLTSFIKRHGRGQGLWAHRSTEEAWREECQRWRKSHGKPEPSGMGSVSELVGDIG